MFSGQASGCLGGRGGGGGGEGRLRLEAAFQLSGRRCTRSVYVLHRKSLK